MYNYYIEEKEEKPAVYRAARRFDPGGYWNADRLEEFLDFVESEEFVFAEGLTEDWIDETSKKDIFVVRIDGSCCIDEIVDVADEIFNVVQVVDADDVLTPELQARANAHLPENMKLDLV